MPTTHPELIATFDTAMDADQAARRVRAATHLASPPTVGWPGDEDRLLVDQQRRETDDAGPVLVGFMTGPQARGALTAGVMGLVLGGLVAGTIGWFVPLGEWTGAVGAFLFGLVGAMAVGACGFVYGGGREPEREGVSDNRSAPAGVTLRVAFEDEGELARGREELVRLGARDVVAVDPLTPDPPVSRRHRDPR